MGRVSDVEKDWVGAIDAPEWLGLVIVFDHAGFLPLEVDS